VEPDTKGGRVVERGRRLRWRGKKQGKQAKEGGCKKPKSNNYKFFRAIDHRRGIRKEIAFAVGKGTGVPVSQGLVMERGGSHPGLRGGEGCVRRDMWEGEGNGSIQILETSVCRRGGTRQLFVKKGR